MGSTLTTPNWVFLGTGNFIGYLTMAIIGGVLAAGFGTRIVISLALVLMGITMFLTGLSKSFGFAFLMRLLTGLGNGACFVPAMALGSSLVCCEKTRFRHRYCLIRHRNRYTDIRFSGSTDTHRIRSKWLASFPGIS